MLLLAGLVSLMAVGATAFYAIDTETKDEDDWGPSSDRSEDDPDGMQQGSSDIARLLDPSETGIFLPEQLDEPTGEIITGSAENDTLTGTTGDDFIGGYEGDDLLDGRAGSNLIYGGDGNDTLIGGDGDDTLHGEDGDDLLFGGDGDDRLFGHDGDDTLHGGAGDDTLIGGMGNDLLVGGPGNNALHGYAGDNTLIGGAGADTLFGGSGDDVLGTLPGTGENGYDPEHGPERNYLNGGAGDDLIYAGPGDVITTGAGQDTVVLGDWLSAEHQAEILDFEPEEDQLMIVYNNLRGDDPEVTLEFDEEVADRQHVLLNGERIAFVENAQDLTLDHVVLLARSLAETQLPS